ncbi:MAG: ATP-binding cassette domain-containing protein [Bryobacteraceae bacterium]
MLTAIPIAARWDRSELPLLLETLASRCDGSRRDFPGEPPQPPAAESETPEWIEAACARLGLEAELSYVMLRDMESALQDAAPAVLALPDGGFAGLLEVRGSKARLLTRDLRTAVIPLATLRDVLCAGVEAKFSADVDSLLEDCGSIVARPERLRRAVLRERAGSASVLLGWQMRVPAGSSFSRQMIHAGVRARASKFLAAYAAEYVLSLGAWWLLGRAALSGRFDSGWLMGWILLMACALAFRAWKSMSSESLRVALGGLLKQRLIAGAVRLDPDAVRREGAGGLLARVLETEALEGLALGGGLAALVAPVELLSAAALLWLGAGGALHALLLFVWIAILVALAWKYQRRRTTWTDARLAMTEDLVERMNGHRTRLAQERPSRWHAGEDQSLDNYLERSTALDRSAAQLKTLVPRLWLLSGLAFIAPAFLQSSSPVSLALSIAAVLMARRALQTLGAGLADIGGAALAWRKAGPLLRAAAQHPEPGAAACSSRDSRGTLLDARDLTFRYRDRGEPVIRNCSLSIRYGDWILLEGESGNGKSTLASLLTGMRQPESGLLLTGGLDYRTLGEARWRRRVAYAPQAHENHIFSASLAFNLLMGRAWPPRPEDLADAHAACRDLGLDDLLARMPAGLDQMVGESGWQLSEGERGRVFLARALLSGANLLVLDECFAALDPESLEMAYGALRRRGPAVLMVAHP